jgi:hypothetical protein
MVREYISKCSHFLKSKAIEGVTNPRKYIPYMLMAIISKSERVLSGLSFELS